MERTFSAASVLHCLPVGMADPLSEGTGAVMRRGIEHDMFRFYRLVTA